MPKIIILRGLPASGKTTYARRLVDETGCKRVNKDDLRAMLQNGRYTPQSEEFVIAVRNRIIETAIMDADGPGIVVDDCHNNPKHVIDIKALAELYRIDCQVIDIDTPVDECIRRDALRSSPVGETRIRQMAADIQKQKSKGE